MTRKLTLFLVCAFEIALILFVAAKSANADSPYAKINLSNGISFELPKNWMVIDQSTKTTLEASVIAQAPVPVGSSLPFAANLFNAKKQTIAMANIRIYPHQTVTQREITQLSNLDLKSYNNEMERELRAAKTLQLKSWFGTKKMTINNKTFLVTSYKRASTIRTNTFFIVTLYRLLNAKRSFTLTLSYDEKQTKLLKPIVNYVANSLNF
jgi:hypothetical protein